VDEINITELPPTPRTFDKAKSIADLLGNASALFNSLLLLTVGQGVIRTPLHDSGLHNSASQDRKSGTFFDELQGELNNELSKELEKKPSNGTFFVEFEDIPESKEVE
jgi:hypothetical protein